MIADAALEAPELAAELNRRSCERDVRVFLLAPVHVSRHAVTRGRLDWAIRVLADAGIQAIGILGDEDPAAAVREIWSPELYDEVLIRTCVPPPSTDLEDGLVTEVVAITATPAGAPASRRRRRP